MKTNKKIWIACSGGVDSVVLTHILKTYKFNIGLLHCNFNLRGEESIEDEAFVRGLAKRLNIEYRSRSFDTQTLVIEKKSNTQIVARELRYNWFNEIIEKENALIALGHHQDDQIESFLIQLERGGGIRGLCAMPKSHRGFIRPLLNKTRNWILEYAEMNNIQWREDSSNISTKYLRNLYRHELLSCQDTNELKEIILELVNNFQNLQNSIRKNIEPFIRKIKKHALIQGDLWASLNILERKELLYALNVPRNQLSEIEKLFQSQKGAYLKTDEIKFVKENDALSFRHINTADTPLNFTTQLISKNELNFNQEGFFLDAEKVEGEIKLRKWEEGDRFTPLGLKGSKRVSKYINGLNISALNKPELRVFVDEKGIIAVECGAPAERVKISKKTSKVLHLTIALN